MERMTPWSFYCFDQSTDLLDFTREWKIIVSGSIRRENEFYIESENVILSLSACKYPCLKMWKVETLICFILIASEKHSVQGSIRRDNEYSKKPNRWFNVETLASILVGKYEWKSKCSLSQEYEFNLCSNSIGRTPASSKKKVSYCTFYAIR